MELYRSLLLRARVSMVSAVGDHELDGIAQTIESSLLVAGPDDLERHLEQLGAASDCRLVVPRTLDLIGHSTTASSLLRLGNWIVDGADLDVIARFRALADRSLLQRARIRAIRLLGCNTAATKHGRETICALAEAAEVEVFGTTQLLWDAHYDANGFREIWEFLLTSSSELRRIPRESRVCGEPHAGSERRIDGEPRAGHEWHAGGESESRAGSESRASSESQVAPESLWPCTLELQRLPSMQLAVQGAVAGPRVATASAARAILALIRRDAGAPMPGRVARPTCEIALPSTTPGAYHLIQVLFDGAFVRCYPGGSATRGVVFPVDDVTQLRRIIDELPPVSVDR